MPLNTKTAIFNGQTVALSTPSKLIKNRMYVPAKFICESLGATYVYDVPKNTIRIETEMVLSIRKDESIGTRLNDTFSGAWWGENITKITRTADTTFTSVLSSETGQRTAYLYEKKDNGMWVEGEAFAASRPVNILADSKGYIHIIAFEPLNSANENTGRIMHMTFDKPNTVKGTYQKTYLTQGNSKTEKRHWILTAQYSAVLP